MKFGSVWLDEELSTEDVIRRYYQEIKRTWYSYDYADYKPIHASLTIYTPGAENTDGYNEWAISEGGVEGQLMEYFFDKNV